MKKGTLLILSILLIFVMVSCSTPKQVSKETSVSTIAETTIPITTEPITTITTIPATTITVTETTIDETQNYLTQMKLLLSEFVQSMGTIGQSFTNMGNGTVSIAQNKEDTANFIKEMNNIYNIYLSLNVPDKYKTVNQLFGTAMDHITNMDIYLQQYIDTKNMSDMTDYMKKAISEMNMAAEYIKKANDQLSSLE